MRLGWLEILVIVLLVFILFGHSKIPSMMKNLADGINVFKRELKTTSKKTEKKSDLVEDGFKPASKKTKKTVKKRSVKNKVKK